MAYTDDAVLAKLSALNETHDSIATAAQWIMFHRRHAERTVQLWFQRLKDSPSPKRLNLIYLANEVTQQSKARHKEDFVVAFSPVIAEAIASAYKGAPSDVQNKLRRVIDVWRDRSIFEAPIQAAVESRLDDLDKAKGASRQGFGGSIFGSGGSSSPAAAIPPELAPLVAPQQSLSKIMISTQGCVSVAEGDFRKVMDSAPPAAPVFAARLNGLLKNVSVAEQAVQQRVKARVDLQRALQNLLAQCQTALEADTQQLAELTRRRTLVDQTKRDVEDRIMRGLNGPVSGEAGVGSGAGGAVSGLQEPQRPEMEALTPPAADPDDAGEPSAEPASAAAAPAALAALASPTAPAVLDDVADNSNGPGKTEGSDASGQTLPAAMPSVSGIDILSHLASQAVPVSTNGANKRRRVDAGDEVPDLDDGIDADVAEALQQDRPAP